MAARFAAMRLAAAPRAAQGYRKLSGSTTPSRLSRSEYELLEAKVQAAEEAHQKICKRQAEAMDVFMKSTAMARNAVKEAWELTTLMELGFLGLAFGFLYLNIPESPSPVLTASEAAKGTAEAAKVSAEATRTAAKAAGTAAEAAGTAAEAAKIVAEKK